jgi:perosamine synthetase
VIPYGRQSVDEDDIAAVVEVLRSDWLTQGPTAPAFEDEIAERVGARFAVAFSSGTAGLHGAAAAAGLGPGDLVATPALTFAASANCARYVGAEVTFVDIDEATLNIDLSLVPAEATALVAVHYAGLPVDLSMLNPRPRIVIEDAAHALGAVGPHGPVGNCSHSDMCVFSFHPVKSITTGEGGVVTTNSPELADRLRRFRNHGIRRTGHEDPWHYEISDTGFNYRLSDIHAALGRRQLTKLDDFVQRRVTLARRYDEMLEPLPVIRPPGPPTGGVHSRHLYPVRLADRRRVFEELRDAGVTTQVHYVPLHLQPLFAEAPRPALPITDRVYSGLLSLPLFPSLTSEQQEQVVSELRRALRAG